MTETLNKNCKFFFSQLSIINVLNLILFNTLASAEFNIFDISWISISLNKGKNNIHHILTSYCKKKTYNFGFLFHAKVKS